MNTFQTLCRTAQTLAWRYDLRSPLKRGDMPEKGPVEFGRKAEGITVDGDSRKAELTWRTERGSLNVSCVDGELDTISMMGCGGRLLETFTASWCRTVGRET